MNIRELLFDPNIDQVALVEDCGSNYLGFAKPGGEATDLEAISSKKGSLCGGGVNHIKFIGDVENKVSIGSTGVFNSRDLFKDSLPYYKNDELTALEVIPSYHFIRELRRQLSGIIETGTSGFGPIEEVFYKDYIEHVDGDTKYDETLIAVLALDKWLVDEVTGTLHPAIDREYTDTHPWMKLGERA